MKKTEKIYPFEWNGQTWTEATVDDLFSCFYHEPVSLRWDGSVYVGGGMSVYPNGNTTED